MPAGPVTVVDTAEFRRWFAAPRDDRAKGRILARIRNHRKGSPMEMIPGADADD